MLTRIPSLIWWEIKQTLQRPSRLVNLFNPQRIRLAIARNRIKAKTFKKGDAWEEQGGLERRQYASYEDYLAHQKFKLGHIDFDIRAYDHEFRTVLRERLAELPVEWRGKTVLCLAARLGTEVKAFIDVGAFAIGIDLNPGKDNKYVVVGDFHDLQYADASLDVVFSNSLDHAFDLEKLLGEVRRVLKPGGILLLEMMRGFDHGKTPALYESLFWKNIDEMVERFATFGFTLEQRRNFTRPWGGEQLLLRFPG